MESRLGEVASGVILVSIGMFYGIMTVSGLSIGNPARMGPGFFPIVLSSLVVLIGSIILFRSQLVQERGSLNPKIPFRPIILVSASIIIIMIFIDRFGMAVTIFSSSFVASRASKSLPIHSSLLISSAISIICTLIFSYIMRVPIAPFPRIWF